jgi:hypothetical protein
MMFMFNNNTMGITYGGKFTFKYQKLCSVDGRMRPYILTTVPALWHKNIWH